MRNATRVRRLLADAAVDRAWRRRGFLAMCRAHPDKVQSLKRPSGQPRGGGGRAKTETDARAGGSNVIRRGAAGKETAGERGSVAASVVELKEDGLFRKIVGYL